MNHPLDTYDRMRLAVGLLAFIGLLTLGGVPGVCAEPVPEVRIFSDRLTAGKDPRIVEFSGNVKLIRGDTTVTADRLLVHPKEAADDRAGDPSLSQMVEKVVAMGRVVIRRGDFEATTRRAVFSTRLQTVELEGKDTRVVSGRNVLTGSRMTLQLEKERIRVTGVDDQRVKAVFQPD